MVRIPARRGSRPPPPRGMSGALKERYREQQLANEPNQKTPTRTEERPEAQVRQLCRRPSTHRAPTSKLDS
eukprot:7632398-Alexandrium_andersonii.AAC.1